MKHLLLLLLLLPLSVFAQAPSEIPRDGARLTWTPPTQRENGVDLPPSELAGYELFWGTTSDNLTETIYVPSSTTQYMIGALADGTWYFAVRAVDTDQLRSGLSQIVSKTIEPLAEPPPADPPVDPSHIDIR